MKGKLNAYQKIGLTMIMLIFGIIGFPLLIIGITAAAICSPFLLLGWLLTDTVFRSSDWYLKIRR